MSYTPKYISQTTIQEAIGGADALQKLSDQSNTAINTDAVLEAIRYAESLIDDYAAGSEGFPWTTVPDRAISVATILAVCALYRNVWRYLPAAWAQKEADALKELALLRDKKIVWIPTQEPLSEGRGDFFATHNPVLDAPSNPTSRVNSVRESLNLL